jgi:hypothetical protein
MQIPDEVRLGVEVLGLFITGGTIMLKLGKMTERFDNHATKLEKVEVAVDKIEDTLATVAVQKEEIRSIREQVLMNTKRMDESFNRVFSTLERLQVRE